MMREQQLLSRERHGPDRDQRLVGTEQQRQVAGAGYAAARERVSLPKVTPLLIGGGFEDQDSANLNINRPKRGSNTAMVGKTLQPKTLNFP